MPDDARLEPPESRESDFDALDRALWLAAETAQNDAQRLQELGIGGLAALRQAARSGDRPALEALAVTAATIASYAGGAARQAPDAESAVAVLDVAIMLSEAAGAILAGDALVPSILGAHAALLQARHSHTKDPHDLATAAQLESEARALLGENGG